MLAAALLTPLLAVTGSVSAHQPDTTPTASRSGVESTAPVDPLRERAAAADDASRGGGRTDRLPSTPSIVAALALLQPPPGLTDPPEVVDAQPPETAESDPTDADQPEEKKPPAPVGGLSQRQMEHAATIVEVGKREGMPDYALVVAIATALQESTLRNLANPRVPRSLELPNDGTGTDHDSVGLFQQRPSTGWGTVDQLMDPEYAAAAFYRALRKVQGWQDMPVTVAAQRVQRSAFPNAYAKHEPLARKIVEALR